ncbi:hypothetical protein A0257_22645 (plasmid) [Hymenobacter psoromatis]|nr:hypothetical protein A0257_22645 [Hymenobacter psoromatis]
MAKIALITGADKGIGFETARQLARDHGLTVLLGARDAKLGQAAALQLQKEGLDARFLLLDPNDAASVEAAAQQVAADHGHLDVLINNAGMFVKADTETPPAQLPLADLRDTFEINVFALHQVTRAFWPLLEKAEAARLVNASSITGSLGEQTDPAGPFKDATQKMLAYDTSKAAVNMMTIHYAWQWRNGPHHANSAHPGDVKTDLNGAGTITVQEGAKTAVALATSGPDGPNGGFFHLGEQLPW